MRTCSKCGDHFPIMVKIDGVTKNLGSRKYCLKCSPFGKHNTRPLQNRPGCPVCGSLTRKGRAGRRICYGCENKREEKYKVDKICDIVGSSCWICHYDKGFKMLDFHHMKDKHFALTSRNIGRLNWQDILNELRKCCLLCCRCHREFHYGVLSEKEIVEIYSSRWKAIDDQAMRKMANPPP